VVTLTSIHPSNLQEEAEEKVKGEIAQIALHPQSAWKNEFPFIRERKVKTSRINQSISLTAGKTTWQHGWRKWCQ